jgi:hypothetical protein
MGPRVLISSRCVFAPLLPELESELEDMMSVLFLNKFPNTTITRILCCLKNVLDVYYFSKLAPEDAYHVQMGRRVLNFSIIY